jgi:hypothetical protein
MNQALVNPVVDNARADTQSLSSFFYREFSCLSIIDRRDAVLVANPLDTFNREASLENVSDESA